MTEKPPQPGLPTRPGIEPSDSLAEAGRKTLDYHFGRMLTHEEGTRLGEDIEELHDMRVATRRMRAAFEVFGGAFKKRAIKPHLKGVRATGRALGRVRDLDVFMEKAGHYLETLPEAERRGLDPLLDAWAQEREVGRAKMLAYLDSDRYQTFKREFAAFLETPGAGARPVPEAHPTPYLVRHVAPVLIYTRLEAVRAYEPALQDAPRGSSRIERLHALRIEFKRLRYTVEFFREVLGKEAKAVVNDIKRLQDHLGDLNDAHVASGILGEFLEGQQGCRAGLLLAEREHLQPVVAYQAARSAERRQLMETFPEVWAYFERPEFRRNLALAVSVL